ncbi:MBL fold metallo-hydrolase [Brachybacterium subflavum]|uniref:MBL fold metallo-hydrolase n=1 Tax=Brachybacterium subflavum TaxID=2585206 RepID=UPI00126658DE|nr:MBL fold metallo-hydrolase [Brachybacterium subflavum]
MAWHAGDITVHSIHETTLPSSTGAWLLPDATEDLVAATPWLRPDYADPDGALRIASRTFALRIGGKRVLVDTGIGNGKQRANPAWNDLSTPYPQRLAEAGFEPESVDLVILTHLHADHVGWNTRWADGRWTPTFPRARYLTSRLEREFWEGYAMDEAREQMFRDSVLPVEHAGLLDLVDVPAGGAEILPGLRLVPSPGHTPGHVSVALGDRDLPSVLITGDCIHHPVQIAHPDIGSCVDIDPAAARSTRRDLLEACAERGTLVLGTHFASPAGGTILRAAPSRRFAPAGEEPQDASTGTSQPLC